MVTDTRGVSRHLTLAEYVLEELRVRIVLGTLAPGTRIDVEQLAKELGSSRIPLREALRQLQAEGLMVNYPRHGVQVREMNSQDVDDAYDLLEYAESLAVKRASKHMTPEVIDKMNHWAAELRRLEHDGTAADRLVAHRSFHFTIFEATGDGLLLNHLRMLWHSCERYFIAALHDQPRHHAATHGHDSILTLLTEGKSAGELQKELRMHLRASRQRTHEALQARAAGEIS